MSGDNQTSIRVTREVAEFLHNCKHKTRQPSIDSMLRKVGGSLWIICEEIEKKYNAELFLSDHEGKEDYFIFRPESPVEDD